jgi:hypothetical protein
VAVKAAERVRASRYRKKLDVLTPERRTWLAAYEQRTGGKTKLRLLSGGESSEPSQPHTAHAVHVHETKPVDGAIDASAATWIPTVPPVANDEAPPPPGAPPPPQPGAPVVEPAGPVGDPAAADQFATLMVTITTLGMRAGLELAADYDVPEKLIEMVATPEMTARVLELVAGASHRVAIKYGFRSIPLADEVIVGVAGVGSLVAIVQNFKRKREPPKRVARAGDEDGRIGERDRGKADAGHSGAAKPEPKRDRSPIDDLWS